MTLRRAVSFALVGWYLMVPMSLRAAGGFAVPGTADIETGTVWFLMASPWFAPPPFAQWIKIQTFPTEAECEAQASAALKHYRRVKRTEPGWRDPFCQPTIGLLSCFRRDIFRHRCVASDDPRLRGN
jgi:hypothetical protein